MRREWMDSCSEWGGGAGGKGKQWGSARLWRWRGRQGPVWPGMHALPAAAPTHGCMCSPLHVLRTMPPPVPVPACSTGPSPTQPSNLPCPVAGPQQRHRHQGHRGGAGGEEEGQLLLQHLEPAAALPRPSSTCSSLIRRQQHTSQLAAAAAATAGPGWRCRARWPACQLAAAWP